MSDTEIALIDFDCCLEVAYKEAVNPNKEWIHPVEIISAKLRGRELIHVLHVGHIMDLQRRVHNRILDSREDLPEQGTK